MLQPEPPPKLLAWTRSRWDAFWDSEVSHATGEADVWAVEVFFTALDDWRRCVNAARKTPFIEGSQGQPRINPMADRADRLMSKLPALAAEIGASPLARSKLAIDMGNAAKTIEDLTREAQIDDDPADDPRRAALVESKPADG